MAIELELTRYLEEEDADALICQFPVPADYDLNGRMVKRYGKAFGKGTLRERRQKDNFEITGKKNKLKK